MLFLGDILVSSACLWGSYNPICALFIKGEKRACFVAPSKLLGVHQCFYRLIKGWVQKYICIDFQVQAMDVDSGKSVQDYEILIIMCKLSLGILYHKNNSKTNLSNWGTLMQEH